VRVFVAGATGAVGEPPITEFVKLGHSVVGKTISTTSAKLLEAQRRAIERAVAYLTDHPPKSESLH
jgi:hypothetical protein